MNKRSNKDSVAILLKRYIWLVDLLYEKGPMTLKQINAMWIKSSLNSGQTDFPTRTFADHRAGIEELFEIIIGCDRQNAYSIERPEDLRGEDVQRYMLDLFAVSNMVSESKPIQHRIIPERSYGGKEFFSIIVEAMKQDRVIQVEYCSFRKRVPKIFCVKPYCLKQFRQRWYLLAYNPKYSDLTLYALDRIQGVSICGMEFQVDKSFDVNTYFVDCFGIKNEESLSPVLVEIKVFEKDYRRDYIRSSPLHHSQQEILIDIEFSIFTYWIKPSYDFRMELLSFGDNIEVLKPQILRDEIRDIVNKQAKIYRK